MVSLAVAASQIRVSRLARHACARVVMVACGGLTRINTVCLQRKRDLNARRAATAAHAAACGALAHKKGYDRVVQDAQGHM